MEGSDRVVTRLDKLCEALSDDVPRINMEEVALKVWTVFDPNFTFGGMNCKEAIRGYFHPNQEALPGLS